MSRKSKRDRVALSELARPRNAASASGTSFVETREKYQVPARFVVSALGKESVLGLVEAALYLESIVVRKRCPRRGGKRQQGRHPER